MKKTLRKGKRNKKEKDGIIDPFVESKVFPFGYSFLAMKNEYTAWIGRGYVMEVLRAYNVLNIILAYSDLGMVERFYKDKDKYIHSQRSNSFLFFLFLCYTIPSSDGVCVVEKRREREEEETFGVVRSYMYRLESSFSPSYMYIS